MGGLVHPVRGEPSFASTVAALRDLLEAQEAAALANIAAKEAAIQGREASEAEMIREGSQIMELEVRIEAMEAVLHSARADAEAQASARRDAEARASKCEAELGRALERSAAFSKESEESCKLEAERLRSFARELKKQLGKKEEESKQAIAEFEASKVAFAERETRSESEIVATRAMLADATAEVQEVRARLESAESALATARAEAMANAAEWREAEEASRRVAMDAEAAGASAEARLVDAERERADKARAAERLRNYLREIKKKHAVAMADFRDREAKLTAELTAALEQCQSLRAEVAAAKADVDDDARDRKRARLISDSQEPPDVVEGVVADALAETVATDEPMPQREDDIADEQNSIQDVAAREPLSMPPLKMAMLPHSQREQAQELEEDEEAADRALPGDVVDKVELDVDAEKTLAVDDANNAHPGDDADKAHPDDDADKAHPGDDADETHPDDDADKAHPDDDADKAHPDDDADKAHTDDDADKAHTDDDADKAHTDDDANKAHLDHDTDKAQSGDDTDKAQPRDDVGKAQPEDEEEDEEHGPSVEEPDEQLEDEEDDEDEPQPAEDEPPEEESDAQHATGAQDEERDKYLETPAHDDADERQHAFQEPAEHLPSDGAAEATREAQAEQDSGGETAALPNEPEQPIEDAAALEEFAEPQVIDEAQDPARGEDDEAGEPRSAEQDDPSAQHRYDGSVGENEDELAADEDGEEPHEERVSDEVEEDAPNEKGVVEDVNGELEDALQEQSSDAINPSASEVRRNETDDDFISHANPRALTSDSMEGVEDLDDEPMDTEAISPMDDEDDDEDDEDRMDDEDDDNRMDEDRDDDEDARDDLDVDLKQDDDVLVDDVQEGADDDVDVQVDETPGESAHTETARAVP